MTRDDFAQNIAAMAFHRELAAARALGYPGASVYTAAAIIMDETYSLALAADRPLVTMGMRMVCNAGH